MATSPDWSIVGPVVGTAGTIIGLLLKRDQSREKVVSSLYEKIISDVVPALERSTAAAQSLPALLERNTSAMTSMVDASTRAVVAANELLRWVAVLSDRQSRDPGPPPLR